MIPSCRKTQCEYFSEKKLLIAQKCRWSPKPSGIRMFLPVSILPWCWWLLTPCRVLPIKIKQWNLPLVDYSFHEMFSLKSAVLFGGLFIHSRTFPKLDLLISNLVTALPTKSLENSKSSVIIPPIFIVSSPVIDPTARKHSFFLTTKVFPCDYRNSFTASRSFAVPPPRTAIPFWKSWTPESSLRAGLTLFHGPLMYCYFYDILWNTTASRMVNLFQKLFNFPRPTRESLSTALIALMEGFS